MAENIENADAPVIRDAKKIVDEAKDRFERCVKWEANSRRLFLDDYKFANGDADNNYQWPNAIRRSRDVDERPCLTINKVRQHNLQIINDAKQNKAGISIRPTGGDATYRAAQVYMGIVRYIEYRSNAQVAYDTALSFAVQAGFGYIRVSTDYINEKNFDQDIKIERVPDPLNVYMDPDCKEADKSDAKFAFVFTDMAKEEFDKEFPQYKDIVGQSVLGPGDGWISHDHIRFAEYFRRKESNDKLVSVPHPDTGEPMFVKASEMPGELRKGVLADKTTKYRELNEIAIERYLIIGNEVVESGLWPGKTIPLVPVIGEETVVEGQMDRKGHTRAMKDPQRIYNYWSSSAVEHVALQGKSPWIAPAEAIEGYEAYWNTANRVNYSVLPFNGLNDAGQPIPPPQRPQAPVMAQAYLEGMQVAQNELMLVSGQYGPQMGEPGNERSGKALAERQRQGDNATYHYIDNLAIAIRRVGRIILELIPKIYDTKRVVMMMAEDGTTSPVQIDPNAPKALSQQGGPPQQPGQGQQQPGGQAPPSAAQQLAQQNAMEEAQAIQSIFNPNVGQYDVQADIGPAYSTKREQAFDAYVTLITQAPQLTSIIGDILLSAADFPLAEEARDRLKRMVPAQALGTGPTPTEMQLQQTVQQLQGALSRMMNELAESRIKLRGKDEKREVDAYGAETDRLKVLGDPKSVFSQGFSPDQVYQLVMEASRQAHETNLNAASQVTETDQTGAMPPPGGPELPSLGNGQMQIPGLHMPMQGQPEGITRGRDGRMYLRNPSGKWLQVG